MPRLTGISRSTPWSDVFSPGPIGEGVNAAVACCDDWAKDARVALEFVAKDFSRERITFEALRESSARFARLLQDAACGAAMSSPGCCRAFLNC